MMIQNSITIGTFKKLLIIILGIFILSGAVSALVLYVNLQMPLGPHYAATISKVTQIRESLIVKTVKINLIFYLLTAIGLTVLGILYSHRIAGPLFKVKQYAAMLGEGRYRERIRFRKKDVVHSLANVLNRFAQVLESRNNRIAADLKKLQEGLGRLNADTSTVADRTSMITALRTLDADIQQEIQKLKL